MSDDSRKKDTPTTAEVLVNWEGLKRFLGWEGSISELKKVDLERPPSPKRARSSDS